MFSLSFVAHGSLDTATVAVGQTLLFNISLLLILLYIVAVVVSNRHYRKWKFYRVFLFIIGVFCCTIALVGPLAHLAHSQFTFHMIGHLMLGMMGPLFVALAAPITLLLRTLPVTMARHLTSFLKKKPLTFVTHPIVASILNIGGLWVLYTTPLFAAMHGKPLLFLVIHLHIFLAGYVFTISLIDIEPFPHRSSFLFRAIVLVVSLAGHGILSKWIYAHPPVGVVVRDAEIGAMLMYYGGDAVDLVLIILLCHQWYKAARPRGLASQTDSFGYK